MRTACFSAVISEDGVIQVPEDANLSAGEAEVVVVQKGAPDEPPHADTKKEAVWEVLADMGASLPKEDWARVPKDLAKNLDNYLYGPQKPGS